MTDANSIAEYFRWYKHQPDACWMIYDMYITHLNQEKTKFNVILIVGYASAHVDQDGKNFTPKFLIDRLERQVGSGKTYCLSSWVQSWISKDTINMSSTVTLL
jgi:hypothetical protein